MAEDQQISGDAGDQGAAGDGSRQRLVIAAPEPGAVHLGDNVHHGSELIVPAGHTWAVQGDVRIGDGAVLKIEGGATLQVKTPPSAGLVLRAAPASSADDRQGGQGKRVMILQAPAELEPGELEGMRERIKRYLLEGEPTEAEQQRLERIKAEADRFALGISPAEQQRLQAQLDGIASAWRSASVDDLTRVFTPALLDNSEPVALLHMMKELDAAAATAARAFGGNPAMAAFDEPGAALRMVKELQSVATTAERLAADTSVSTVLRLADEMQRATAAVAWQAIEPATVHQALEAKTAMNEYLKGAVNPVIENITTRLADIGRHQSEQIGAQLARVVQPIIAQSNNMQAVLRAMDQYQRQTSEIRISQVGVLVEIEPRPGPPAKRVQAVHLADEALLAELDQRLRDGAISPKVARSMFRLLQAHTGKGKPGPQEPPLETKIKLIEDYERLRDKKGITQPVYVEHYAHKICAVSLRTFQSYAKDVRLWRESHSATE